MRGRNPGASSYAPNGRRAGGRRGAPQGRRPSRTPQDSERCGTGPTRKATRRTRRRRRLRRRRRPASRKPADGEDLAARTSFLRGKRTPSFPEFVHDGLVSDGGTQSQSVVLVEDNAFFLRGLARVLGTQGLRVLGTAVSGEQAIEIVRDS